MNLSERFGAASYRVGVDRFHRGAAAQLLLQVTTAATG
jgi:hypothetical protein